MNKIIIGETMTKKKIFNYSIGLSFFGLFAGAGFFNIFHSYSDLSLTNCFILSFLIYMLTMLFLTPILGSSEILEFTKKSVNYYHVKGAFQQFFEVIRILKNKPAIPNTSIKTDYILKVNLSYLCQLGGWAQKGYRLKMTFLMKDGSTFTIFPTSVNQMEKGDYEKALQLLENQNIEIIDKHNLRPVLNTNSYVFQSYIESLEKEKTKP